MARILVTDGEQRSALAVVRSLARADHEVFVCASRRHSLAGASRYCAAHAAVPDVLSAGSEFVTAVRRLASDWRVDVLLPISEAGLLAVLSRPELFSDLCVPFPDLAVVERVCDKAAVLEKARTLGIGVPAQYLLTDSATPVDPHYPVVVKPSRSVVGEDGARIKTGAVHAVDANAFADILRSVPSAAYPLLAQERIVGTGVGVFVLLWQGRLLAKFGHRRLREKPPWGGVSVYRASTEVPQQLLDASVALLRALDWNGVAMVEYKLDDATGDPYLMEINGRFWGSLQLAIDAGVDFPALLVNAALGETQTAPPDYTVGVRSRWWWGDVDHLIARLRHSKAELGLPNDAPGRAGALLDFLKASIDGSRNEVFWWSDVAPAMIETVDWLRGR